MSVSVALFSARLQPLIRGLYKNSSEWLIRKHVQCSFGLKYHSVIVIGKTVFLNPRFDLVVLLLSSTLGVLRGMNPVDNNIHSTACNALASENGAGRKKTQSLVKEVHFLFINIEAVTVFALLADK